MLKIFRKIRQNHLEENKIGNYLKYVIGEILLIVIGKQSPASDLIWVEQTISQTSAVPLGLPAGQAGTGYVGIPTEDINHIAYLRHAISDYISVILPIFCPYGTVTAKTIIDM